MCSVRYSGASRVAIFAAERCSSFAVLSVGARLQTVQTAMMTTSAGEESMEAM